MSITFKSNSLVVSKKRSSGPISTAPPCSPLDSSPTIPWLTANEGQGLGCPQWQPQFLLVPIRSNRLLISRGWGWGGSVITSSQSELKTGKCVSRNSVFTFPDEDFDFFIPDSNFISATITNCFFNNTN